MNKNYNNNAEEQHDMHEKIKQLFLTAKNEKLSRDEKNNGSIILKQFMDNYVPKMSLANRIVSYCMKNFKDASAFLGQMKNRKYTYAFSVFLIIFVLTGGTAYAAQSSLPGSFLYPVKIHVNEKVESAFAVGPEEKSRVALKQIITRLEEAETLSIQGKMNADTEHDINENILSKSKEIQSNILKIKDSGDINTAILLNAKFKISLSDHKKEISNFVDKTGVNNTDLLDIEKNINRQIDLSVTSRLDLEKSLHIDTDIVKNKNTHKNVPDSQKYKVNTTGNVGIKNSIIDVTSKQDHNIEKTSVSAVPSITTASTSTSTLSASTTVDVKNTESTTGTSVQINQATEIPTPLIINTSNDNKHQQIEKSVTNLGGGLLK